MNPKYLSVNIAWLSALLLFMASGHVHLNAQVKIIRHRPEMKLISGTLNTVINIDKKAMKNMLGNVSNNFKVSCYSLAADNSVDKLIDATITFKSGYTVGNSIFLPIDIEQLPLNKNFIVVVTSALPVPMEGSQWKFSGKYIFSKVGENILSKQISANNIWKLTSSDVRETPVFMLSSEEIPITTNITVSIIKIAGFYDADLYGNVAVRFFRADGTEIKNSNGPDNPYLWNLSEKNHYTATMDSRFPLNSNPQTRFYDAGSNSEFRKTFKVNNQDIANGAYCRFYAWLNDYDSGSGNDYFEIKQLSGTDKIGGNYKQLLINQLLSCDERRKKDKYAECYISFILEAFDNQDGCRFEFYAESN